MWVEKKRLRAKLAKREEEKSRAVENEGASAVMAAQEGVSPAVSQGQAAQQQGGHRDEAVRDTPPPSQPVEAAEQQTATLTTTPAPDLA